MPDQIVSGNGPQFTSTRFRDFCQQKHVQDTFSLPIHHQTVRQKDSSIYSHEHYSNREERGQRKKPCNNSRWCAAQLKIQAHPGGISPAEMLIGRKLKTIHNVLLPIPPKHPRVPKDGPYEGSTVYLRDFRPGHPVQKRSTVV